MFYLRAAAEELQVEDNGEIPAWSSSARICVPADFERKTADMHITSRMLYLNVVAQKMHAQDSGCPSS